MKFIVHVTGKEIKRFPDKFLFEMYSHEIFIMLLFIIHPAARKGSYINEKIRLKCSNSHENHSNFKQIIFSREK